MPNSSGSFTSGCGMSATGLGSFSAAIDRKRRPGNAPSLYDTYMQDAMQNGVPTMTRAEYKRREEDRRAAASARAAAEAASPALGATTQSGSSGLTSSTEELEGSDGSPAGSESASRAHSEEVVVPTKHSPSLLYPSLCMLPSEDRLIFGHPAG